MKFFRNFKKCIFCHKKDDKLEYANKWGLYGMSESEDAFHPDCVKERVCNPEKFGSREVDRAIDITDRFEKTVDTEKLMIERRKNEAEEACKFWHQKKENV
jgi:hypothetical protein